MLETTMTIEEIVSTILKNPVKLSEEQIEIAADACVRSLAAAGANYGQAYQALSSIKDVIDEAVYHLGHNAAIEMNNNAVSFVLDK